MFYGQQQTQAAFDPYANLPEADESKRLPRLKPGFYDVEIVSCQHLQTRKKGLAFICEFKIARTSNPDQAVGTTSSWFRSLPQDDQNQLAMATGQMKTFVKSVAGYQKGDDDSELLPMLKNLVMAASDQRNLFKGFHLYIEAVPNEYVDKDGKPQMGTNMMFLPAEGSSGQQRQEMAARYQRNPNPVAPPQRTATGGFGPAMGGPPGYGGAPPQGAPGYGAPQNGWGFQGQPQGFQGAPPNGGTPPNGGGFQGAPPGYGGPPYGGGFQGGFPGGPPAYNGGPQNGGAQPQTYAGPFGNAQVPPGAPPGWNNGR